VYIEVIGWIIKAGCCCKNGLPVFTCVCSGGGIVGDIPVDIGVDVTERVALLGSPLDILNGLVDEYTSPSVKFVPKDDCGDIPNPVVGRFIESSEWKGLRPCPGEVIV
jgi:hypothetical protein